MWCSSFSYILAISLLISFTLITVEHYVRVLFGSHSSDVVFACVFLQIPALRYLEGSGLQSVKGLALIQPSAGVAAQREY